MPVLLLLAALAFGGAVNPGRPGSQLTLKELLGPDPVVRVDYGTKGTIDSATAIVLIRAPVETVWRVIRDVKSYPDFMPRIAEQRVEELSPTSVEIFTELETPFRNKKYTFRYNFFPKEHRVEIRWVKGDLRDSAYEWQLRQGSDPNTTVGFYYGRTRNFSGILTRFEDEQHTVSLGVNVATVLAVVRAVKQRSEGQP